MDGHTEAAAPLLDVQDLTVKFVSRAATVTAVNGATFSLRAGEVLCLLGESGSEIGRASCRERVLNLV